MSATSDAPAQKSATSPTARSGFRSWPRWGRWATYVSAALALLLVAGMVAAVAVVRRPFPTVDGEIELAGLDAEVDVLRDENGVPHVYADTAEDLFHAQGFVHAQDRFFEMDFRRHVTSGRLAELLGKDALETDKFVRTMGWRRVAEEELALLQPETLDYLEAYSAGVNDYLASHDLGEMGLEYSVLALNGLEYSPEEWTPVDSVAWLKAMAWDLRGNMEEEIQRAIMSVNHTAEEIDALYPSYPYRRHQPVVNQGAVVDRVFEQDATSGDTRLPTRAPALPPEAVRALERLDEGLKAMPDLMGKGQGIGSNGWVVDGEHSTTGEPILANDPHLGLSVPGIWHQMGLHCNEVTEACPFDVGGFTFSGVPGVVIGHNQQIAWGFTNLGPDVVDLYLEKVDGRFYEYDGQQRPLEMRDESIEVLGEEEPFRFTVRSTKHGPLLSDVSTQLSTVGANARVEADAPERGNGYAVALSWTALTPNRTMDAMFMIDKATSWDEFRTAAEQFAAPSQNMLYADRDGHIGYQAPGLIPIRRSGHTGEYPAEGWNPANDWTGNYVPFDALPTLLDPEAGMVVSANQAVVGRDYPYYLGTDGGSYGYRSQRILELLRRKERHSVEDMARMQLDSRNGFAPTFVPYLLDVFMPSQYLYAGQRLLERWDYQQDADSAAAAYYNTVWRNTLELTFHDQLQESVWPDGGGRWFEVMRMLLADPTNRWWDDIDTEAVVETRDDILATAMENARNDLVRTQARRPAEWTWGHHHRLNLENQTLGQSDVGLVQWLFNRGGYEVGGGSSIVNATGWTAFNGFQVDWAPSMRMVVSMEDLDDSRWVNLTGVSGHSFNSHYVDQTELYVAGETLPWTFSRDQVEESAEDTLTLLPAGSG
ncbi:MAG TPA: penicillin acylase family protein [Nocardioidaceae bacterium]|nr:penicillin acylase family protein [Nocardioidaceae bacterium]